MYYVGIDGGGTQSSLAAIDNLGREYGPYFSGATNLKANTPEQIFNNIACLINSFLGDTNKSIDDIAALCIGSAGVDIDRDAKDLQNIIRKIGLKCPLRVSNDCEIIIDIELENLPGAVLVSGTGSVAYGKDALGNRVRSGGWGHLLGDEGSGYWIAREGISSSLKYLDGRGEKTILPSMLCEYYNLAQATDIVGLVYAKETSKSQIADFAYKVVDAAKEGDAVALKIIDSAADDLSLLVKSVYHQLGLSKSSTTIISGGMLVEQSILTNKLLLKISDFCGDVIHRKHRASLGAAILASRM